MEQVVYADVLWLIDFSMDLLALGLAGRMAQREARGWRLCAAAALGGVWSVLALLGGWDGALGLVLDLAVAAGMSLLAFGRASPGRFALTLGSFFLATLLLGGSMTALANLFAGEAEAATSGGGFFLLALAGSGITLLGTHLRRRAAPRRVTVTVTLGERTLTLDALTDSGNLLRDPVTGRGVIFVAPRRLGVLVDAPLRGVLLAQRVEAMADLPAADARRLCLVPASTVQGRGMLLALRPDSVSAAGEPCAALICPMADAHGRDYDAILPADLAPAERHSINI
ncbi:MAG: sigma-E processing peptidase SpoIIGA [Clostridia bacterium]|nr:sigma-E processing peptidase SpoIIGA [Clostridia bacterium]